MRKAEINNEVVALRQSVRRARICVINKLIREAKKLRGSHGNEKQIERNKNKADRLLREVFALKRIKEDEISKFGIVRFENLANIIQDPRTDDGIRAMAKIARFKLLNCKIMEFHEKYPDCKEYITWRKKREKQKQASTKKKRSIAATIQKERVEDQQHEPTNVGESKTNACDSDRAKKEKDELKEIAQEKANKEEDRVSGKQQPESESTSKAVAKTVSTQATVKRFTEILETEPMEGNERCEETKSEPCAKERLEARLNDDDFFVHATNASTCSRVMSIPEDANKDAFNSSWTSRNREEKLHSKGMRKERIDPRRRNTVDRNVPKGRAGMKERSGQHRKESRNCTSKPEKRSASGANAPKNDNNLHPSWEAKRKQQDIMKQGFQGKKIKFDED